MDRGIFGFLFFYGKKACLSEKNMIYDKIVQINYYINYESIKIRRI